MKSNREDYEGQRIVDKFLRSLPQKHDNLLVTIEEENDLMALIMDELVDILQTHGH